MKSSINQVANIKAVLWDIDGTLLDSEPLHFQSLQQVCRQYGYEIRVADERALVGKNLEEIWRHLNSQSNMPVSESSWRSQVIENYTQQISADRERPGVCGFIAKLAQHGIRQACVSSGEAPIVAANIAALGVHGYMECIISCDDVDRVKPDPEPYQLAASKLNLAIRHCLVVEDSCTGIMSAKTAGMLTVAWPHSLSDHSECRQADYIMSDLSQFPWHLLQALAVTQVANGSC